MAVTRPSQSQCASKFRFDILEAQLFRAYPCNDQEVMGRLQIAPIQPKKFSHESLHPIALDGVADAAADRDPESAIGDRPGSENHDEVPALAAPVPSL